MRKLLLAVLAVSFAATLPFGHSSASAQAPDSYGWWWALREPELPVDPRPLSPVHIPTVTLPTPPGIPADGMYVDAAASRVNAISAISIVIPEGATATTLTLVASVPLLPTTQIMLCPTTTTWQPANGGRWASRPLYMCTKNPPIGVVPTDGSKITFNLGELGKSQLIDVALVPMPNSVFRATLKKPDKTAFTVTGLPTAAPDQSAEAGTGSGVLGMNDVNSLGNALANPDFIPNFASDLQVPTGQEAIGQSPQTNFPQQTITPATTVASTSGNDTLGRLALFGLFALVLLFNRFRGESQREPRSLVNFGKHRGDE